MSRRLDFASATQAWLELLPELLAAPAVEARGRWTRELVGQQLVFDAQLPLLEVPARDLNYRFAAAEALWIVLGRRDLAPLARVNSKMRQFSDDGATLAGAYGPRFREQLPYVLETLRHDPGSRQAVVDIWRPSPEPSKDIPCTLSWQFLQRRGVVDLVATMRSSDAWLGVPYDAFSFSVVLQLVAGLLGAGPGRVCLTLGSSHLYEDDVERVEKLFDMPAPLAAGPTEVFLHPMSADEFAYFELVAGRALEKGALVHAKPLPAGWDRLLAAVCSASSTGALERLRGI